MKCEIISTAAPLHPGSAHCVTHNMPLPHMMPDDLCPIGKIKQAVEEGLAIIRAARDELPPKK